MEALAQHLMGRPGQVPIVFTQLRPGDKMCEALLSDRESYVAHADASRPLRAVKSPCLPATVLNESCANSSRPAGNAPWNSCWQQ